MKYKKTILILSLFIIFFVYIGHSLAEKSMMKSYEDRLIRFHIKANSDTAKDQSLKLKIRDKILDEIGDRFGDTKSLDESRNIIRENMKEMKNITENVIREEGEDYEVDISLGRDSFPTRRYGDFVLPGGEYETLLISLGEGKGKNWWCVMFPPLCFVDITHSVALNVEEDIENVDIDTEEEPELKLKWKVAEIFEKFKDK